MIDHLRSLVIFAKTVEHGSFRLAARELQLSPSVVSHHISQLEEKLGVALMYRSTRKLSLTRHGERVIGSAQQLVRAAKEGISAALDNMGQLSGELRVAAPAVLAQSPLATWIAAFMKSHPRVRMSIDYSDYQRDVIADGIDIAIRMGRLRDSMLKARKLYDVERVLLASNAYMAAHPTPKTPKDIEDWDWMELTPVPLKSVLLSNASEKVRLRPTPRLRANNVTALYQLCKEGAGLAILPRFLVKEDIRARKMQIVFPEWQLNPIDVYAVRLQTFPRDDLADEFVAALAKRI